ncbi:outer membrane protein with beta-barrel domain [Hydrogenivirga caldilitoris]|uniref:Outer membrane protein with beta-barrel domain n=1 Tax=Hydrogenivirga caldilitoris TaxID=246264 RepID=A0A497XNB1_9AQUI|nr:outer membrane beta-barrel protein [Hydrogenivirga caldilitoris]RLJ70415.1 outer membrane protein with beta-barrel domain [Hydrogenivirga caldilitoris]
MKRFILAGGLILSTQLYAVELGVKLGNARINWSGGNDSTTLEGYVAFYGEYLFPVTPVLSVGPNVELGYGKKSIGTFYCAGYGTCSVDLTYTTLELNAKAVLSVAPVLDLYGGAGISSNRFGLDAKDPVTDAPVGTIGNENGGGAQAFAGAQLKVGNFGAGLEYKYKAVDTESVDSVDVVALTLFVRF